MAWNPQAAPQDLPTKDKFKHDTRVMGKRKSIRLIDIALEAWEADHGLENSTWVYKECRHWLKAKEGKNSSGAVKRRGEIFTLLAGAIQWIAYNDPELGVAFEAFHRRKAGLPDGHADAHSMPGVYQHERSTYMASGKEHAMSATEIASEYLMPAGRLDALGVADTFSKLTEEEYISAAGALGNVDVIYLRKMSRLRFMLMQNQYHMLCSIDMQLFTTDQRDGWPFAMDRYGNLFCADNRDHGGQFNHSSFNAGREVICAGNMKINNGQLIMIDNNSGHYQPPLQQLENAIINLRDEQVDLSACLIEAHDYETQPGFHVVWEYTVDAFLGRNAIRMGVARDRVELRRQAV